MTIGRDPPLPPSFCGAPPPVVILRSASSVVILRSASSCCHSEERTTKNLRCLDSGRVVVVMNQPSKEDLRFLTPFGMTVVA